MLICLFGFGVLLLGLSLVGVGRFGMRVRRVSVVLFGLLSAFVTAGGLPGYSPFVSSLFGGYCSLRYCAVPGRILLVTSWQLRPR